MKGHLGVDQDVCKRDERREQCLRMIEFSVVHCVLSDSTAAASLGFLRSPSRQLRVLDSIDGSLSEILRYSSASASIRINQNPSALHKEKQAVAP